MVLVPTRPLRLVVWWLVIPGVRAFVTQCGPRRQVVVVRTSPAEEASPFAFADAVQPTPPKEAGIPLLDWLRGRKSDAPKSFDAEAIAATKMLAELDAKRAELEEAIAAAQTRTSEARSEAAAARVAAATLRQSVSARDVTATASEAAARQAEEMRARAEIAKQRAAALGRSRAADIAEAVRVARTDLARAETEAAAAARDLAAAREDTGALERAKADAKGEIAATRAQVAEGLRTELRVKPTPALTIAALAGLLACDALKLDNYDLIGAGLAVLLMLSVLPSYPKVDDV